MVLIVNLHRSKWKVNYILCLEILFLSVNRLAGIDPLHGNKKSPCGHNHYASFQGEALYKCSRCTQCKRGYQLVRPCNETHDAACEQCPNNKYSDTKESSCKPCKGCSPGEYVRKDCTINRDTICRKCPESRFSDFYNASFCRLCHSCKRNEVIIRHCTKSSDTVCGTCEIGYFRAFGSGECLSCSKCPEYASKQVVNECVGTFGLKEKNELCWPQLKLAHADESTTHSDVLTGKTETDDNDRILEVVSIRATIVFLCLLLTILLLSFFMCASYKIYQSLEQCGESSYISNEMDIVLTRVEDTRSSSRLLVERFDQTWDDNYLRTNSPSSLGKVYRKKSSSTSDIYAWMRPQEEHLDSYQCNTLG